MTQAFLGAGLTVSTSPCAFETAAVSLVRLLVTTVKPVTGAVDAWFALYCSRFSIAANADAFAVDCETGFGPPPGPQATSQRAPRATRHMTRRITSQRLPVGCKYQVRDRSAA